MVLSDGVVLVYVLRDSGCRGRFTAGRVERVGAQGVNLYNRAGELLEYFSGTRIRSWCVFGPNGQPVEGWREVALADVELFPRAYTT